MGAALVLIAVGAILRFALTTVASHGLYLHTVGDILMIVGVLGLILWIFMWGPWSRTGRSITVGPIGDGGRRLVPAGQLPARNLPARRSHLRGRLPALGLVAAGPFTSGRQRSLLGRGST